MTYFITFRSRGNAILMKDKLSRLNQGSSIMNAPSNIASNCSLGLQIDSQNYAGLMRKILSTNIVFDSIFINERRNNINMYRKIY